MLSLRINPHRSRIVVMFKGLNHIGVNFVVARIVAAALLFWALDRHPYDYYTILRFVVCGVTAYGFYQSLEIKKSFWSWIFGITALVFNPFIPIHLSRDSWAVIDIIVGILLIASIFFVNKQREDS